MKLEDLAIEPLAKQAMMDSARENGQLMAEQENNIFLFSIATSLKRIADALEPVVVSGSFSTESLTSLITHLAWEGGRSFQHGLRTDR